MNKKIKWGILGPGIIAHEFAQDFKYVSNAELVAVASRSEERARSFADQYTIPYYFDNYDKLYEDPGIDAIYIATPHNFHFEQTRKALESGKAVLCEKPITISSEECQELMNIQAKTDCYLTEGMWTHFLPVIQKVKEWVEGGKIGDVFHVKSSFGYPVPFDADSRYYNPKLAGGSLYDMGIYNVAIASFLLGAPSSLRSEIHYASTGADDDCLTYASYGEVRAVLHSAFRCKLNNHTYIIGEKGYIDIPDFWRARECYRYERDTIVEEYKDYRKSIGFEFEIEAVSNDILDGKKQSEIVPLAKSLEWQETMERILVRQ